MAAILLATQVPLPLSSTAYYDLSLGGLGSPNWVTGDSGDVLVDKENEKAARVDILGRFGGGIYGVGNGVLLSAGAGLTLNVGAGLVVIDALVDVLAQTLLLTDAARNHIWISRAGIASARTDTTAPGTDYCYAGSALCAAGAISSVDTSGIIYLRGGLPWRETADLTVPGDTPASTISFLTKTLVGDFLWSPMAAAYRPLQDGWGTVHQITHDDTANYTPAPANVRGPVLVVAGTLTAGRNLILPTQNNRQWHVNNKTGQTITFKTVAGTGVAVATTKQAALYGDGVNIEGAVFP